MMRKHWRILAVAAALLGIGFIAHGDDTKGAASDYVGTWSGSWEGGGSGRFDLAFERAADGQISGGVSVGTAQGDYTAKFKELSFDANKMKAKYDFPLAPDAEIIVDGTFEAGTAGGSWTLVPRGDTTELAGGAWKVTKQ